MEKELYSPLIGNSAPVANQIEDKMQAGLEMLKAIPPQDLDDMLHMYFTGGQSGIKEFFFRKALDEIEDWFINNDLPPDT